MRRLPPTHPRVHRAGSEGTCVWAGRAAPYLYTHRVAAGLVRPGKPLMRDAVDKITAAKPGFKPKVGIILGSGLGPMAADVDDATTIECRDLPGFPQPKVAGHAGRLSLGMIGHTPVAVLQGRSHYYEHGYAD